MANKRPTTMRLSSDAQEVIEKLSRKLGLSKTAVVEMSVRLLAEREQIARKEEEQQ